MAKPKKQKNGARESQVVALLAGWPPLAEAHRDAFRALVDDGECERLGKKTKSAAVLKEATAFCKTIDRALRAQPFALRRYGAPRFAWMLECVHALEDAVLADATPGARAMAHARRVHADLVLALEIVASGNAGAAKRLEAAKGSVDGRSLRALAELADELGRSDDLRTRALVASVTLRADDAHAARAAAAALEAAPNGKHDSAETDRVEGRVLAEMRFAKRMFDRVRASNRNVPAIKLGKAASSAGA
jgi:hypothetical protein